MKNINKTINKILTCTLIISFMGTFTGCSAQTEVKTESSSEAAPINQSEVQSATVPESEPTESNPSTIVTASEDSSQQPSVLVVYYSATGTTAAVANTIAELTGGDILELEPTEAYSSEDLNWRDDNSRVSQEHQNPDTRNIPLISATTENWESYDTIFIGYPIWWGIAAWPVNGFIEVNNFTGKTVIPFCTAASSELGESGTLLAEQAGTGTWQEGARFRSNTPTEELQAWINNLGL